MNFLERAFTAARKSISAIIKDADVYTCSIDSNNNVLLNFASLTNSKQTCDIHDNIENIFINSISIIPQYKFAGEYRCRTDVLLRIARELHYFPFAGKNGSIYISTLSHKEGDIASEYCKVNELFKKTFGCEIGFSRAIDTEYFTILEQRINDTYKFYVEEHGAWIERFMSRMGDDISRDSYAVFLRQRIMASIFDDSPICYPVLPPAKTASWRRMRESQKYSFPVLRGVNQDILEKIFYKYIYIYMNNMQYMELLRRKKEIPLLTLGHLLVIPRAILAIELEGMEKFYLLKLLLAPLILQKKICVSTIVIMYTSFNMHFQINQAACLLP